MPSEGARVRATGDVVDRLARFFPAAAPVRLPIRVERLDAAQSEFESTTIEFATGQEIFFASALPLEFGEKLRVRNSDQSLDVEVQVVAVQYDEGRIAVVARFMAQVSNWIVKA